MLDCATSTIEGRRVVGDQNANLVLACQGLGFKTQGITLLKDVSVAFSASGISVVMGPNGAGKSLFLRLLHGLIRPTSGTVTLGNDPVSAAEQDRQSMVFQKPVLMRRSVGKSIDFILRAKGQKNPGLRDALLARVALQDRACQPARLLSGGEQQRLALARALAIRPNLLFLDEPTASLDPASAKMIEEILKAESACGTKVILVTHDIAQARRLADEVVFLVAGQLVEKCSADNFLTAPQSGAAQDYLAGRLIVPQFS